VSFVLSVAVLLTVWVRMITVPKNFMPRQSEAMPP